MVPGHPGRGAAKLTGQRAGAQIAGGAGLLRGMPRAASKSMVALVAHHADPVANPLGAKQFRSPSRIEFRPANFAGVNQAMQARYSPRIHRRGASSLWRLEARVRHHLRRMRQSPANAIGSQSGRLPSRRLLPTGGRRRKSDARLHAGQLRSRAGVAQRAKICFNILVASQEHHAHRKSDLRVENILFSQGFGESARDQARSVVSGFAKQGSHLQMKASMNWSKVPGRVTLGQLLRRSERLPWRAASSTTVAGSIEPSRCTCSSAFGSAVRESFKGWRIHRSWHLTAAGS